MSNAWNNTKHVLPQEGKLVKTMSEGGLEQELKRKGSLWFVPDGSMYVYYTPMFWKDM